MSIASGTPRRATSSMSGWHAILSVASASTTACSDLSQRKQAGRDSQIVSYAPQTGVQHHRAVGGGRAARRLWPRHPSEIIAIGEGQLIEAHRQRFGAPPPW